MKKPLLALVFIAASWLQVHAQQEPQFTHFMFDRLSVNPGFTGTPDAICATLIGRQQWSGFNGAPSTALLNVHGPLRMINSGIGLSVYHDVIGPYSRTAARASFAYHLNLSGATKLSLGASVGIMNGLVRPDWIAWNYSSDGLPQGVGFGQGDMVLTQERVSSTGIDAAFGAYVYNPKWYAGLSAIHLPAAYLEDLSVRLARHYYLMAGYNFEISPQFTISPNILAKTDLASAQFDANATVMYDDTFWLGVTYRLQDAIAPMAGYQYQMPDGKSTLRIGYSYDITASELNNFSSGSHEIFVNFCHRLQRPLPTRVFKNPRFL